jgi:hypothetical protein
MIVGKWRRFYQFPRDGVNGSQTGKSGVRKEGGKLDDTGELIAIKAVDLDQGWEIQDSFNRRIYNKAEYLLKTRNNTLHTRISYHYALNLLEAEGGDPRVVLPAILLHDVGYSQLPEKEIKDAFGPIINHE